MPGARRARCHRAPHGALGLLCLALLLALPARAQQGGARVLHCTLEGTVDAGSVAYLTGCVRAAEARQDVLLVRLDTPGGQLEATREVTRSFLGAKVPVLVWVGPSGARAGSAGLFLVLASNVAGMAPGTNIGAAHPVAGPGGADPEQVAGEQLARKVVNDTVAFAEAVARQRGRNAAWAASAVRESASIPAERAVSLGVVELQSPSEEAFLRAVSGRTVQTADAPWRLDTAGAQLDMLSPSFRQRLVHWLANPSIVYLLFVVGALGIAIELASPGVGVAGALGGVSLLLALVALSVLPIQAGAVVLLLIGVGLILAELAVPSGLLGLGGVVLLVFGGLLLVDRVDPAWFVEPSFRIPLRLVLPVAVALGGMATYVAVRAAQARRRPMVAGDVGLVGEHGRALSAITAKGGEAFVHGERWSAVAPRPVPPGAPVVVRRVEGLTLFIEETAT